MNLLAQKSETSRSNRASGEEFQFLTPDGNRWRIVTRPHVWRPPTDVYETDDAVVIRVEIAGMREEDFSVSLEDRSVIVRGVRSDISERRAYHQMEIPFGEFSTEIELLCPVASEGIAAVYQDGFLRVTLPKTRPYTIRAEE